MVAVTYKTFFFLLFITKFFVKKFNLNNNFLEYAWESFFNIFYFILLIACVLVFIFFYNFFSSTNVVYLIPFFFFFCNTPAYSDNSSDSMFTAKKDSILCSRFQSELGLLNIFYIWGFHDAYQLLGFELLYKKQADFFLKFNEVEGGPHLFKFLLNLYKKDLEIFIAVLNFCENFNKTVDLAPRFFNIFLNLFGGFDWFRYSKDLFDFVIYEKRRQKYYLPRQVVILDKNLDLAKGVLDAFVLKNKPDTYFLLKKLYVHLFSISQDYRKFNLKKFKDYRSAYSVLRQIVINYSDIIKLLQYRLELEYYIESGYRNI